MKFNLGVSMLILWFSIGFIIGVIVGGAFVVGVLEGF